VTLLTASVVLVTAFNACSLLFLETPLEAGFFFAALEGLEGFAFFLIGVFSIEVTFDIWLLPSVCFSQ
jgi:hypothetical protein